MGCFIPTYTLFVVDQLSSSFLPVRVTVKTKRERQADDYFELEKNTATKHNIPSLPFGCEIILLTG